MYKEKARGISGFLVIIREGRNYNCSRIAAAICENSSGESFSFGLVKSISFSLCIGTRWI